MSKLNPAPQEQKVISTTLHGEAVRVYRFPNGASVRIERPVQQLNSQQSEVILSADGNVHRVRPDWIHMEVTPLRATPAEVVPVAPADPAPEPAVDLAPNIAPPVAE